MDPATLARSSQDGMVTQRVLAAGFVLLLLLIAIISAVTLSARRQNARLVDSFQARAAAYELFTGVQGAETAQRGYLLAHDADYLRGYDASMAATRSALARLKARSVADPARGALAARLTPLLDAKFAELDRTVALGRAGDWDRATAIVRTNTGRTLMDAIGGEVARARTAERQRLSAQIAHADQLGLALLVLSVIGTVLLGVLAVIGIRGVRRQNRDLAAGARQLADANNTLERRVQERTAALTTANEEVQRFAYLVSHDLRAPLVNVMGFTSELEAVARTLRSRMAETAATHPELVHQDSRLAIEEDLPEAIGFIRTSTAKMDSLINAILKLSRDGRRVLAPVPIDMIELVRGIGRSLATQLDTAGAVLDTGGLPPLTADRLAVEQVFGNLIENAVKYLQPGRPGRIEVSGVRDGAACVYRVVDNGRGIAPEDHARVFELFRRAGRQDRPGEGIGLAHVQSLVRRLGGSITLESVFGEGSVFTVRLPAAAETGNAPSTAVQYAEAA